MNSVRFGKIGIGDLKPGFAFKGGEANLVYVVREVKGTPQPLNEDADDGWDDSHLFGVGKDRIKGEVYVPRTPKVFQPMVVDEYQLTRGPDSLKRGQQVELTRTQTGRNATFYFDAATRQTTSYDPANVVSAPPDGQKLTIMA